MALRLIVLIILLACISVSGSVFNFNEWLNGDKFISFKRKTYDVPYNVTNLEQRTALSTYVQIAEKVITSARKELPYGTLTKMMQAIFSEDSALSFDFIKSELLEYERPYLVMAGIPLVLLLMMPVVGFIFFFKICRRKEKRTMSEFEVVQKKKGKRFLCSSIALTGATLILISGIAGFLASERLDNTLHISQDIVGDGVKNIYAYINNTAAVVTTLLGDDYDIAFNTTSQALHTLPDLLADRIVQELTSITSSYYDGLLEMQQLSVESVSDINILMTNKTYLVIKQSNITAAINKLKQDVQDLHTSCLTLGAYKCTNLNYTDIRLLVDFRELVDLSNVSVSLSNLIKSNNSGKVAQYRMKMKKIPDFINGSMFNSLPVLHEKTKDIKDFKEQLTNELQSVTDMLLNKLESFRNTFNIRGNGLLKQYKTYISIALKVPCYLMILMCAFLTLGLATAELGVAHTFIWDIDEFSPSMKMARIGKDLLLSFLYLFVLVGFLLLLLLSVILLLGANMTHIANGLKDGSLIEKTVDNKEIWGDYALSKFFSNNLNSSVSLKLSDALDECKHGRPLWQILDLGHVLNMTGIVDMRKRYPSFEDIVDMSHLKASEFVFVSDANTSVQHLQLFPLTKSTIDISTDLISFDIFNLRSEVQNLYGYSLHKNPVLAANASAFITQLNFLEKTLVADISQAYKYLSDAETRVSTNFQKMMELSKELEEQRGKVSHIRNESNFAHLLQWSLNVELHGIMRVLIIYGDYLWRELTSKVGKCDIIPTVYDNLRTLFCVYLTDSVTHYGQTTLYQYVTDVVTNWFQRRLTMMCLLALYWRKNAMWLSLATTVFAVVVFLPVYKELIVHYRIASLDFNTENGAETERSSDVELSIGVTRELSSYRKDSQWL